MADKAVVTKSNRKGRSRRKTNLTRLYTTMNKMTQDAVDKEIVKRFKILIDTSDEDLPKVRIDEILKDPGNTDVSQFHESLQPYIRHYLFMNKRQSK
ncbi:MAG: hypothetical protein ACOC2H_03150 [Spirochaetota bacterium]